MTEAAPAKTKIAILGGGMGAMTAAFMLTDRPELRDQYDITVYQMGWRLGGKGASGRNRDQGDRIEEHGPHFFAGFYANAFWLMQKCYRELGRPLDAPLARWDDAFKPHGLITLMEAKEDGGWVKWELPFPIFDDKPGFPDQDEIPAGGGELSKAWEFVEKLLGWLRDTHGSLRSRVLRVNLRRFLHPGEIPAGGGERSTVWRIIKKLLGWLSHPYECLRAHFHLVRIGRHLHNAVHHAEAIRGDQRTPSPLHHQIRSSLETFVKDLEIEVAKHLDLDDAVRRFWILLRLGVAIVHGLIADEVYAKGFDDLDGEDLRGWLKKHGAPDPAVSWSAPVRAIYDLVFAYKGGDTNDPNLAAGAGLRGALRLVFDYKGAVFWKMQAGMGDVVFAPLYEVLKTRDVKFRFFHRVENLGLSPDQKSIDTVDLTIQATVKPGLRADGEYYPLYQVKNLSCWPSTPLCDQLVEGDQLMGVNLESAWTAWQGKKWTLQRGKDFDLVILGISLGALPFVCQELIAANSRWHEMVQRVQTVQTQQLQLWMTPDAEGLGWTARDRGLVGQLSKLFRRLLMWFGWIAEDRAAEDRALVGSYVEPWNTWTDMSQLIVREQFPQTHPVRSIAYICGLLDEPAPIPDPGPNPQFPDGEYQRVKDQALEFLKTRVRPLWPSASDPNNADGLNWNALVDLDDQQGVARFDSQFWRANIDPSERYVLSVTGSTASRIRADKFWFGNLCLAGDWTVTGLNAGCVEAAVMSGMQAARKISGHPWRIVGEADQERDLNSQES